MNALRGFGIAMDMLYVCMYVYGIWGSSCAVRQVPDRDEVIFAHLAADCSIVPREVIFPPSCDKQIIKPLFQDRSSHITAWSY